MRKSAPDNRQLLVEHILNGQTDFYRLAVSYVKNRDAALDVVQEAIVKALSKVDSVREPAYLKTWFLPDSHQRGYEPFSEEPQSGVSGGGHGGPGGGVGGPGRAAGPL